MDKLRERLFRLLASHPILRQTLLWSVPAILFGLALRLMFLHYSPYAYWGADSKSYYSFAHEFVTEGDISLDEKRRFVYPILLAPISFLPGAPLRWVAIFQHAFGIICLLPLAYVVRKTLSYWRWWIIPVTVLYAGMPLMLWYEHELLGETVFFGFILWAFAGWVAWASEARLQRARYLFWWFFVPFALFILTKPAGRFYWPGILVALLLVQAWKKLNVKQYVAIVVLMFATLLVGSRSQGAWLFYVASFPLTQLDSPLHTEYKAQIRDLVEPLQSRLDHYYREDTEPFEFLDKPDRYPGRPLWNALKGDTQLQSRIYLDLALEGVRARPVDFALLSVHRIVASANISEFKGGRFRSDYSPRRLRSHYAGAAAQLSKGKGKRTSLPLALGLPERGPLPPYEEFQKRLSPAPDSWTVGAVNAWVRTFEAYSDLVRLPTAFTVGGRSIYNTKLTALGCWMILGFLLSFLPRYRNSLGCWALAAGGYLFTFFLISQANPRYFAPAWPVLIVLLAVPADILVRLVSGYTSRLRLAGSSRGVEAGSQQEVKTSDRK